MASVNLYDNPETDTYGGSAAKPLSIDDYYAKLSGEAKALGVDMDPTYRDDLAREYQGVNGVGARTSADIYAGLSEQLKKRAASTSHREADSQSAAGNALYGSGTGNALNIPGGAFSGATASSLAARAGGTSGTFSDPWTAQLEALINQQLQSVQNPAAGSPQATVMDFLMQRFNELANSPGYTADEQAILNTQALEPIEDLRAASKQRALQSASARGFLPSSGLTSLTQAANGGTEQLDTAYDRMRTVANRDLAVNAINKRNTDLASAVQLGQAALSQDQGQMDKALQLATLLYQLPIQAQNQALAVINGTGSPQSLLPYIVQMAQANQQQSDSFWQTLGYSLPI